MNWMIPKKYVNFVKSNDGMWLHKNIVLETYCDTRLKDSVYNFL